jgi:hypothetical protein
MVTQLRQRMPTAHTGPVTLQGLGLSGTAPNLPLRYDQSPTLLKRTDPDFITAILDELQREAVFQIDSPIHQSVLTAVAPLTLLQPVHRTFYVALLEAVCDSFDIPELQPRLEAKQIHSAGLVVRRIVADGVKEAWQTETQPDGSRKKGWFPLTNLTVDLDPDSTYQTALQSTGHIELDRQLQANSIARQETVSALYVAPPNLCNHLKRTVLYGVVPVTSNEVSEVPPVTTIDDMENAQQVSEAIQTMLPLYLRAGGNRNQPIKPLTLSNADALRQSETIQPFIDTLRQLKFHFQAFDNATLLNELNQITVQLSNRTQPLGQLLQQATQILVDRQPGQIELPTQWPPIATDRSQRIFNLLQVNLLNRLSDIAANEGRFEDNNRSYQVRAFIRLHGDPLCPPRIIWSAYSSAFQIAPWYANGDAAPVKVALPDIMDFQTLKSLKPSVAFSVPPNLFNFLKSQDPADPKKIFQDGPKENSGGIDIDWICSFNIPIITLCAYIVLNLFISLFNLIFQWIFIIKICIPIPKPK